MRTLLLGFSIALGLFVTAQVAEAQQCYRLTCNTSQSCTSTQVGTGGKCCCDVDCVGGEGGVTCTCSTFCQYNCGIACPSCELCQGGGLRAGEGFRPSPELIAKAFNDHPLTAQVLKNLSRKYSRAVGSGIAEGKSNAGWVTEYSYKARLHSSQEGATLDFVFEGLNQSQAPPNVRTVMDTMGNVSQAPLSEEDAKTVLTAANQSCQPVEAQVGELKPEDLPWIAADSLDKALHR